jgi:hypothetical protein
VKEKKREGLREGTMEVGILLENEEEAAREAVQEPYEMIGAILRSEVKC